jgi:hypothetical protein
MASSQADRVDSGPAGGDLVPAAMIQSILATVFSINDRKPFERTLCAMQSTNTPPTPHVCSHGPPENSIPMKVLRFILATIVLILVWLTMHVGVGALIMLVFEPRGTAFLWFWLDWHALPGFVIGLVMGVRAFRQVLGGPRLKRTNDTNLA